MADLGEIQVQGLLYGPTQTGIVEAGRAGFDQCRADVLRQASLRQPAVRNALNCRRAVTD